MQFSVRVIQSMPVMHFAGPFTSVGALGVSSPNLYYDVKCLAASLLAAIPSRVLSFAGCSFLVAREDIFLTPRPLPLCAPLLFHSVPFQHAPMHMQITKRLLPLNYFCFSS